MLLVFILPKRKTFISLQQHNTSKILQTDKVHQKMFKNTVSNKKIQHYRTRAFFHTAQENYLFFLLKYHNAPSIYCELRKCYVLLKTLANKRIDRKIQALTVVIIQK